MPSPPHRSSFQRSGKSITLHGKTISHWLSRTLQRANQATELQMLAWAGVHAAGPRWEIITCPHSRKERLSCSRPSLPGQGTPGARNPQGTAPPGAPLPWFGSSCPAVLPSGVRWETIPNAPEALGRQPGLQAPCRRGDCVSASLSALWSRTCKASRGFFLPLHLSNSLRGFYGSEREQTDKLLTYGKMGWNSCRNFPKGPSLSPEQRVNSCCTLLKMARREVVTGNMLSTFQSSPDISCDLR